MTKTTTKWSAIKAEKTGRPVYDVDAQRDGRFWFLRIRQRPELFTQTVRLDAAEAMVRDLVATWDEVAPDSFDLRINPVVDEGTTEAVEALDFARTIGSLETALARGIAVDLVNRQGLSMRDAALVLKLSHQRIAQLINEQVALPGDTRPAVESLVEMLDMWTHREAAIVVRAGDPPEKRAAAVEALKARLAQG